MWETLHQESFLLGAALILVYQAARFRELDLSDPIANRYLSLLPGAGVRDFAGPQAYRISLVAFLGVSFMAYLLLCTISPNVVMGAAKLLGASDATQVVQGMPYPLYIAATFMGLTQPIIPALSQLAIAPRTFFHDQIRVPRRIIDIAESLTSAIEARAGNDRGRLAAEMHRLTAPEFLSKVTEHGDLAYYRAQLDRPDSADSSGQAIGEHSGKELRTQIRRLVLSALVAVMRKSGPSGLDKVSEWLRIAVPQEARPPLGLLLSSITASGLTFLIAFLIIGLALHWASGPVEYLFGKSAATTLWPTSLEGVFGELWAISAPVLLCLLLAVCWPLPSPPAQDRVALASTGDSLADELPGFIRSSAPVLLLCIAITLAFKIGQMFFEYGSADLPAQAKDPFRLLLPILQSFIVVAVCLLATWYFWSLSMRRRGMSFSATTLMIAGVTGFIALLHDLAFLEQYLRANPDLAPGREHCLFSVIANALVAICAFSSVALYFRVGGCQVTPKDSDPAERLRARPA